MWTHGSWLKAALLAVLVAAGFGTVIGVAGGAGLGSASFTDPAGDVQGAPDITTVAISDNAGLMQFALTATGMNVDMGIYVYMDTDGNSATGYKGEDYALTIDRDKDGNWWNVVRWDGQRFADVPQSSSMGFSRSGDTYTLRLSRADIGDPSSLTFWVLTFAYVNGEMAAADRAPDGGTWVYQLTNTQTTTTTVTSVTPLIGKAKTTPAVPTAGKRVTVTFPLTRKEDGSALTSATMMCDPMVGTKVLAHSESIGPGVARLSFVLPKNAKGKTLKVNLTIRVAGKTAHTVASFRVK